MDLQIAIIEDEPEIRNYMEQIVAQIAGCTVIVSCGSVAEGVALLRNAPPDVLLLDIQLSDGTGFDLLDQLAPTDGKVIFVTGYDQYALKAIKVGAIDYLLKPFEKEELELALKKADTQLSKQKESYQISKSTYAGETPKRIVLRSQGVLQIVNILDIMYCQSFEGYTTFYFTNGDKFLVSKKIKEYDTLLSDFGFIRCHQSYLVNILQINKIKKEGKIQLKNNTIIPISQRKREDVIALLKSFL